MVNCEVCNKEFDADYQDYLCCNGYECGCYGKPTEPITCSLWCFCYAYHIREGKWSVVKNYLHTLWINTKLGWWLEKKRQNRALKKWKIG